MANSLRRDLTVAAVASALTIMVALGARHFAASSNNQFITTSGRRKLTTERAFVLTVGLRFADEAAAKELLSAWSEAAAYCLRNEPFLYSYQMARSDKDSLSYVIIERYRDKADYLGAHRHSPAFKAFRPRMRALQDSGKVVVSGDSYNEIELGFM